MKGFLAVRGLAVDRGGVRILSVMELDVPKGAVLALIGPNGAGKSTLLLSLAGIARPSAGMLFIDGREVDFSDTLPYRRRIAMAFQEPLLFDTTVFANVAASLRFRGWREGEVKERVAETLDRFRIPHLARRSARTLSGGEAQRTSLARALAARPEILLLDEPFSSLDPPTQEALIDDLEVNLRQTGTTAVFATQDRVEALRLADRIAVMMNGRIAQEGAPGEVFNQPADEAVATFVGMETLLEGIVEHRHEGTMSVRLSGGKAVEVVGGAREGETVRLGVRPENVTLSLMVQRGGPATSVRNHFAARVERIVHQGPVLRVMLNCGFPLAAHVTVSAARDLELHEGSVVTASVKATAIHVMRRKVTL